MLTNLVNFGAIAALFLTLGCNSPPRNAEARSTLADSATAKKAGKPAKATAAAATDHEKLADLSRMQGDVKAPVWVIVMSDFQCPACKAWHDEVFPQLRKEFIVTGKIRFAYVNFPLRRHPHAIP